jgi:hypothetical protein
MTGRALKNAETIDGALVPALTAWDKRVLAAVPAAPGFSDRGWSPAGLGLDAWMVARAMREMDVSAVRSTLRGLCDRSLVMPVGFDTQRKPQRWVKRPEGLE